MFSNYVIITFLLALHVTIGIKIEVEYDEKNNIILHDETIYLSYLQFNNMEENQRMKNLYRMRELSAEHGEEKAQGFEFWMDLIVVICNN